MNPEGEVSTQQAANGEAVLDVSGLSKQFDGLVAVDGCSFRVEPGTVTGLIGPNGAGKSTAFNLITGVYKPDQGDVVFQGAAIGGHAPNTIAARGMGRTFQTPRLFLKLTVWENLMVAAQHQPGEHLLATLVGRRRSRDAEHKSSRKAHDILAFLELARLTNDLAGNLSGGQRKLLSLGRVLMMDPTLILLDEPVAGVNETLGAALFDHIAELNRQGITFLIIEHDMDLVMRLCDTLVVMHNGQTLAQGTPSQVQQNQAVLDAYLGGQV